MLQPIQDGHEFERKVCSILYKTNPYNLSYYDGGPDRGRDICVQYQNENKIYNVIVECKFYNSGVNKEAIMPALDWAKVHQPNLLYLWIVPYLTPTAKDFVQLFEKTYKISVRIEEKINIEEYYKYIYNDNANIWRILRQKILNSCIDKYCINFFVPEYELDKSDDGPFLIDRELEREKLLYQPQKAFYLQGVSACGKTQLLKYIAFIFMRKGMSTFWYTVHSGNVEQQCSDFFHTLARYFESVHQDKLLLEYFNTYGFFFSQDLENIVLYMLDKYNPILFFDDVHNCQNDNISMRTLFKKLIKRQTCRVYFSGWFNIFNFLPNERVCISTIILEGMQKKDLNLIIKHCSGEYNTAMAELIEEQFYGLPGYAVLVDKEITVDNINKSDDFLVHFLTLLSTKEKIVLFTLSLLTTDVPGDFLIKHGYSKQLVSLENKHLIVVRKCCYAVHDKYREFFLQCTIEDSISSSVKYLMKSYAILEPSAFLDLINYYILEKNHILAWDIISENFPLLISCQFYLPLLDQIQNIERSIKGKININSIIIKKIVLLERLGEYKICLQYISLLGNIRLYDSLEQETIFYVQLRCLYFTNKYDDILKLYKCNYSTVENFINKDIYIQVLLIIGRVFYIRGSSNGALIYYLLAYYNAQKLHNSTLEVKAIHRIAMIERRLGLVIDSRKTFQELLKLETLITPKRRSYIYYRIAKCFYNEGDLKKAKEYNNMSIKIKESYNDTRGLLFSETLNSMICLEESDYIEAYCNSTNACKRADNLGLHKEWLTAAIVNFRIYLHEMPKTIDISADLQRALNIAIEEKLLIKLKSIEKLTKAHWPHLSFIAKQNKEMVESELKIYEEKLCEYFFKKNNFNLQQDYEELILNNKAISESLLLRSGFLDPLLML